MKGSHVTEPPKIPIRNDNSGREWHNDYQDVQIMRELKEASNCLQLPSDLLICYTQSTDHCSGP